MNKDFFFTLSKAEVSYKIKELTIQPQKFVSFK